jgi:hypothetical protein
MRAALCVHSWMGVAMIGWALLAHLRERVWSAPVVRTKRPAPPLERPPACEVPQRGPVVWN